MNSKAETKAITNPVKISPSKNARRTRPIRPAPKFWPMIGPMAPESAKITPKATGVSRPAIAIPATAASP